MLLATATILLALQQLPRAQQRPNIILILADDHAAHAVSAYRPYLPYAFPLPATPNIDRLAREGMLFRNAFVTNSICGPARAAILTGQYGHLTGVMTNFDTLHATAVTFPGLLRRAGYQTAIVGKWHLVDHPAGFDHYELLHGQGTYYNPVLVSERDSVRFTGYSQDVIADHALAWLRTRDKRRPFYLQIALNAPHRPWEPGPAQLPLYRDTVLAESPSLFDSGAGRAFRASDPEMTIAYDLVASDVKLTNPGDLNAAQLEQWRRWYEPENAAFGATTLTGDALTRWKYQRFIKDYMRAVAGVDAVVGRVLDELKKAGLEGKTVVVYSSDQGFFLGDHGWFDKRWMYEESLRTPLLVRWPGVVRAGSVNGDLVMNLDLAETFLEMGGVQPPADMQGASFVPLLRGRTPAGWRDAIYYQYFAYPDWHMVRRQYGVRDARYKLVRYYEVDRWELFDLARDPYEMHSVYDDPVYSDVVARMKQKLTALRAQYREPERDPARYRNWTLPAEYRRTVQPDTARR